MTREEADFIGGMNMCDEISNEAYRKIMCHCEEQEPCEDAVSRQAVLDLIANYDLSMGQVVKGIHALPPVNPSKTGHWIIEKWNNKEHYSCSNCQHVVDYEPCYHYCPYCGAKMVEPQESEVNK